MTDEEIKDLENEAQRLKAENEALKEREAERVLETRRYTSEFAKKVVFNLIKVSENPAARLEELEKENPDAFASSDGNRPLFAVGTVYAEADEIKPGGFWHRRG